MRRVTGSNCHVTHTDLLHDMYVDRMRSHAFTLYLCLRPIAGRPSLPPVKCIGRNNNNTAANSGLWTVDFGV